MFGRRITEGLHQAIEAKEGVHVPARAKTLATITFQNYFRLYEKLSGMTGTAMTEEEEFATIYELDMWRIPTNSPSPDRRHGRACIRRSRQVPGVIRQQIEECHAKGQPVLVGTVSIEKNEALKPCSAGGHQHNVLNAKNHEREAEIVAQAGQAGPVTVATNMAGRGTDIMLGGNAEYWPMSDLRKAGLSDALIAEATGYAETETRTSSTRQMFTEARGQAQGEDQGREPSKAALQARRPVHPWSPERHESRGSTTSCAAVPAVRADPGEPGSILSLEAMTHAPVRL